jgi:hypothetical protein
VLLWVSSIYGGIMHCAQTRLSAAVIGKVANVHFYRCNIGTSSTCGVNKFDYSRRSTQRI